MKKECYVYRICFFMYGNNNKENKYIINNS